MLPQAFLDRMKVQLGSEYDAYLQSLDRPRAVALRFHPNKQADLPFLQEKVDWAALDCEEAGTASDGDNGLALILEKKPDILLTSIRMPGKTGLEVAEKVRAALPDCKIIFITKYAQFQYACKGIKLGVFDYLLKPINPDEIA